MPRFERSERGHRARDGTTTRGPGIDGWMKDPALAGLPGVAANIREMSDLDSIPESQGPSIRAVSELGRQ